MAKLKYLLFPILLIISSVRLNAQNPYVVMYHVLDSLHQKSIPVLKTVFSSPGLASNYIAGLPQELQDRGYISASIDSLVQDSLQSHVYLFLGEQYQWTRLRIRPQDEILLEDIRLKKNIFDKTQVSFKDWQNTQQVLLNQLEELGYPFASVFLDSIGINGSGVEALLAIDRGPLYKIDSIRA